MRSIVDPTKLIDQNQWLIAILQKPSGTTPEHVFLIVEGVVEGGNHIFRRYELCQDEKEPDKAVIKMQPTPLKTYAGDESVLKKILKREFLAADDIYGLAWNIPAIKAEELHRNISASKDLHYHSIEHGLVSPSGDYASCYAWACDQLLRLHLPSIRISPPTLLEQLAAERANIHLTGENPEEETYSGSKRCCLQ